MPEILLATINAKYAHAAFGLRYLMANLGPLQPKARLLEFHLQQRPIEMAERILAERPLILGLGVYIWNVAASLELLTLLRRLAPSLKIILGGPEVSYETESQAITRLADHVLCGEADAAFPQLCEDLLAGEPPDSKILAAELPGLDRLALPYALYDDEDIRHRIIYVEASRGCPFTCEFCLSSLDIPVRQFPLPGFLAALQELLDRGARQYKFVDRTFNLNLQASRAILEFFLQRLAPGLFLHFEMIPDRLPPALRGLIAQFPAGTLQFEVGIQTFNPEVAARIRRRQDYARLADNFGFLRRETGVYIHADLIAGLPGESLESFASGFDQLIALGPQEIQVGLLKRLRGTPISRHDEEWSMVYSPLPPYEILQNKLISFEQMQQVRRFARHWDLIGNSGNFIESTPLLWSGGRSPFQAFWDWSCWLGQETGRPSGIPLAELVRCLFVYLTGPMRVAPSTAAAVLWRDYQRGGRSDRPAVLRPYLSEEAARPVHQRLRFKRQTRYFSGNEPKFGLAPEVPGQSS